MSNYIDDPHNLTCSFCGKSQREVKKLIAGPTVYICDECIELCNEIIAEEYEEAIAQHSKALEINKLLNNRKSMLKNLSNLGGVHFKLENYSQSLYFHKMVLDLETEAGNKKGMARALNNLGSVYAEQGKFKEATANFNKSLKETFDATIKARATYWKAESNYLCSIRSS